MPCYICHSSDVCWKNCQLKTSNKNWVTGAFDIRDRQVSKYVTTARSMGLYTAYTLRRLFHHISYAGTGGETVGRQLNGKRHTDISNGLGKHIRYTFCLWSFQNCNAKLTDLDLLLSCTQKTIENVVFQSTHVHSRAGKQLKFVSREKFYIYGCCCMQNCRTNNIKTEFSIGVRYHYKYRYTHYTGQVIGWMREIQIRHTHARSIHACAAVREVHKSPNPLDYPKIDLVFY